VAGEGKGDKSDKTDGQAARNLVLSCTWVWSREPPDFGGKLNLILGRGSRGVSLLRLENCNLCVIISGDKNVTCNKRL
jgi:hypothetical protein